MSNTDTAGTPTGAVDDKDRYKWVTGQINYHNDKMIEAFNLFIRLFSVIVAGCIWLSTQSDTVDKHHLYGFLANVLIVGLGVITFITVLANLEAWVWYKKRETELDGESRAPLPPLVSLKRTLFHSSWNEVVMLFGIFAACAFFWCYNPLLR